MEEIRFDDIAKLQTKVSEQYGAWSDPIEITQTMIDDFAELTGDHQWIHVDVERSKKESPFGTTIAHGFLLLSLLPKLKLTSNAGGAYKVVGHGNAVNYGADKLRFAAPVASGSKLHGRLRILGYEAKPAGTQVTQEVALHVVGNERPALVYRMLILYQASKK